MGGSPGPSAGRTAGTKEARMLVVTRKVEQAIIINGNIVVRILGVEGIRVKIGIDAPKDIPILREELTK